MFTKARGAGRLAGGDTPAPTSLGGAARLRGVPAQRADVVRINASGASALEASPEGAGSRAGGTEATVASAPTTMIIWYIKREYTNDDVRG